MIHTSHAPAEPAKPHPSTPTARDELAALLQPYVAEASAAGLRLAQGRIGFVARLLTSGAMDAASAIDDLDSFAADRAAMARGSAAYEERARLVEASRIAGDAADRLRFASLPSEGPGAALVPLIREASERKLITTRTTLQRACRALVSGESTPEVVAADLDGMAPPGAVLEGGRELLERAVLALVATGGEP